MGRVGIPVPLQSVVAVKETCLDEALKGTGVFFPQTSSQLVKGGCLGDPGDSSVCPLGEFAKLLSEGY